MSATGPSRRTVLLAAPAALLAGTGLAGCTREGGEPAPVVSPPVGPDEALRGAAAERERSLLREYDAALAALPDLAARLLPLRGEHAEHLEVLLGPTPTGSPSPATAADASGTPAAPAVPPPADTASALARLAQAERGAADLHARACLAASRELAAVLASLSASELSHPVALR